MSDLTEKQIDEIIENQKNQHEAACKEIGYNPAATSKTMLRYLVDVLSKHSNGKPYKVVVEAAGGGDSGEIHTLDVEIEAQTITYFESERKKVKMQRADHYLERNPHLEKFFMTSSFHDQIVTVPTSNTPEKAVEALCYSIVDLSGVDWYNDAGGEWAVTIENGSVNYSMKQFYQASTVVEQFTTEDLEN